MRELKISLSLNMYIHIIYIYIYIRISPTNVISLVVSNSRVLLYSIATVE